MLTNQSRLISSDFLSEKFNYNRYIICAFCSALFGLPLNILLLIILIRNGLYQRRKSTDSFQGFLFEIVLIDILLILYYFLDNFFSYLYHDRSAGEHYLIHLSDFSCKFFTYFAKMSVLLTTWLLLFLLLNQLIQTIKSHRSSSRWQRSLLPYINAKYSTVFLIFTFSLYNIYPIEVLKYQSKGALPDYERSNSSGSI